MCQIFFESTKKSRWSSNFLGSFPNFLFHLSLYLSPMATLLVQSSPSPPRSPTWGEARERLLSSDQVLPDFNLNKRIYPDVKGLTGEPLNIINALREPFSRLPEVWYLYDDKGSILFEEITKQPEYYVAHKVSLKKRRLNGVLFHKMQK